MKKKKNLSKLYFDSFNFIRESKKYILIGLMFFIIFAIVGYYISPSKEIELQILEQIRQIALKFNGLNFWQTAWKIFSNNISICFLSIFSGAFFSIFPTIISISNGYIIGFVANMAVGVSGVSVLWKLVPHGIFEIPAIIISIGLGIGLGASIFKQDCFKLTIKKSIITFFLIIIPLMVVAALIETFFIFRFS